MIRFATNTIIRVTILAIVILCSFHIYSQRVIVLSDSVDEYKIGKFTDILFDSTKNLAVNDVAFGNVAKGFKPLTADETNLGYRKDAVWLRFTVQNNSKEDKKWLLSENYSVIDKFILYSIAGNKQFIGSKAGIIYSMNEREVPHRLIVFPLIIKEKGIRTYFIQINSGKSIPLDLTIWKPDNFYRIGQTKYLFLGIFYGGLLIMAIYNLFLFFSIKDKSYLFYFLYAVDIGFYQLNIDGLSYQFITKSYPIFNTISVIIAADFVALFGSLFTREFLNLRKYSFLLDLLFKILIAITILYAIIIVIFRINYSSPTMPLAFIYIFLALISGAYCIKRKNKNALFYLLATTAFLIGISLRNFRILGLMDENFFTEYGWQIGILAEMTILSFALGNRINMIKREEEKEKSLIRNRIARDLHDEIGSNLSSISLSSQLIRESPYITQEEKNQLEEITITSKETADSIRDIIWFINPEHDKDGNLVTKMKSTAAKLLAGINYSFIACENINIRDLEHRKNIYLIYKEILNNIVKHSEAENVSIIIEDNPSGFQLKIKDEGKGYDKNQVINGNGLKNIENRVMELKGKLKIKSEPGQGTEILISIKKD